MRVPVYQAKTQRLLGYFAAYCSMRGRCLVVPYATNAGVISSIKFRFCMTLGHGFPGLPEVGVIAQTKELARRLLPDFKEGEMRA